MLNSRTIKLAAVVSLLALGACDNLMNKEDPQPRVGSLTQNLNMVDSSGRIYGTIQLDPINGGKIYDADGRLIGRVIQPTPGSLAPVAQ